MRDDPPIGAVLADIEQQIEVCEEQRSFHAAQTSFHAERQAFHQGQQEAFAAELEKLRRQRETFRAVAEAVRERAGRRPPRTPAPRPLSPEERESFFYPSGGLRLTTLVRRLVEERAPGEVFGRTEIAQALHVALGGEPQPELRKVSMALLRLAEEGRLEMVRRGSYRNEALYRLVQPGRRARR
jgi:hypothetical protein